MTRDEAEQFVRTQAREQSGRETFRWTAKEHPDGSWSVVNVLMPPRMQLKPLKTTTSAQPEPPPPDDPRTSYDRGVGGPWFG